MDRTPPEILFSILEYVATTPDHAISQYAAVTRDWQVAVEHITFRSLRLSASDLDAFQEAFQGEKVGRRGYLRALEVQPTFTENRQPDECCEATRVLDREADGKVWSSLVTRLFIILDDITQRSKTRTSTLPPVALTFLSAFRGARKDYPPLVGFSTRCTSGEHEPEEIEAARAPPGTIEFYGAQTLPSLPHIATIIWHGWGESKFLRPTWIGQVAKKLPDLRDLVLQLEDAYDWGCTWRRHYQSDLAESFATLPASTLETFHLVVHSQELLNEDVPVQRLSTPGSGDHVYDRLLQQLSAFQKLRVLYLTGPLTVTPALFQSLVSSSTTLRFPYLEEFALEFAPQTADGRWFYLRDDLAFEAQSDEEDEEEDPRDWRFAVYTCTPVCMQRVSAYNKFRSLPNPETLTPFLVSAARACAKMPKIRRFSLKLNTNEMYWKRLDYDFVDRLFELWFLSAGTTMERFNSVVQNPVVPPDDRVSGHKRVYFRFGNYKPDDEVISSWREVVGKGGKVVLLDEAFCRFRQPWGNKRMQYTGDALQETEVD